jgi:hypothetical protein
MLLVDIDEKEASAASPIAAGRVVKRANVAR